VRLFFSSFASKSAMYTTMQAATTPRIHSLRYQMALQLNNNGAFLAAAGNVDEAIATFSQALILSRLVMVDDESSSNELPVLSFDDCMHDDPTRCFLRGPLQEQQSNGSSNQRQDGFIFNQLLCTDDSTAGYKPTNASFQSAATLSTAITFNLALTYHLSVSTETTEQEQRKRLDKAKHLYVIAWKVLGEVEQSSVRFTAAIVNNLGQVLKAMGEDQSATHCFQHLLSIVMYTVEAHSQDAYQYYQLPELEKYLKITSYLVLLVKAAAAA
jgi:tetratricopeptide (TPR) repeat protein